MKQNELKLCIREQMQSAGLPFPKITSDEFFFIEFKRPKHEDINEGVTTPKTVEREGVENEGLNEGLKILHLAIQKNPGIKAKELTINLNRPIKTIERQIKALIEKKLIIRKGSRKTGGNYLV